MKVISVNVGRPRQVGWAARNVTTGIFKKPVVGPVWIRTLNVDGDGQADLVAHGGPDKAVYGYPSEHYPYWREQYPALDPAWGMLGENLTTEGLFEYGLCIGDLLRVGRAVLMVTQPRTPCFKLGIRFSRRDAVKRFRKSGRSGFYFSVVEEGEVSPDDPIEIVERDPHRITVADVLRAREAYRPSREVLERILAVSALPEDLRSHFEKQLDRLDA
jgi:MOSC domain-containing protein YiiM